MSADHPLGNLRSYRQRQHAKDDERVWTYDMNEEENEQGRDVQLPTSSKLT
jgi:hypothetical protein